MSEPLYTEDTPEPQKASKSSKTAAEAVVETSPLQRLKETISKKVERPEIIINVPERPGVQLRIRPNITQQQMKAWRRNAGEDTKAGMDATKFACYLVGHTTDGILIDGEEVHDDEGHELNFASREVLKMTDTTRPVPDAVREFFGVDPHIEAAALTILDAAGYSDTVDAVDPTMTSSKN
jgi:hypothetical protein